MLSRHSSVLARRRVALYLSVMALFVCVVGMRAAPERTTSKWWFSPTVQRELRLTRDQADAIDRIFESTLAERRVLRQELDRLERELQAAMDGTAVDDATTANVIARLESARARHNVTRTLMLYRIRKVLTPDQRHWFDDRARSSPR